MHRIFIDGHVGTTGLLIHQHLQKRDDIELSDISDADRKDNEAKRAVMSEADLVILCLPDDAARESVALAPDSTRFIDASTAHRTHSDWVYGLAEINQQQRDSIRNARCVSNPGCWATGFLLPVLPLINTGLLSPATQFVINGVSGYSGGGRGMIERYRTRASQHPDNLWYSRPYSLGLQHKHLPEMQQVAGLDHRPVFQPSVGHFHQGMLVSIPLFREQFLANCSLELIYQRIADQYGNEECIKVHEPNNDAELDRGFLDPQANNETNRQDIFIFGHQDQILLISILDNLGKGASGAAVQNMNLMLGTAELQGLTTESHGYLP